MKKSCFLYLLFGGIFTCINSACFSQTNKAVVFADVKGIVRDSAEGTSLFNATIAIYAKDTVLLAYTITDRQGSFLVKNLPTGVPLKIIASFVGYTSVEKKFVIPLSAKEFDVETINMKLATATLETVVITAIPPVRVNGDTLEFNADAFKLDKNAQAEDLLRILPGVLIWSDGAITVNGREVKSVLVNGKPFFDKDSRIAIQNLPKNIIDKVQVYHNGEVSSDKPQDSTTAINIKLKKGKDNGYFGKLGAGYGTNQSAEIDGSLNFFNAKTQLSLAGVYNNINKVFPSMDVLLLNHTFKGAGLNTSYQPDFNMRGYNNTKSGGFLLQHDFKSTSNEEQQQRQRLNARGFISKNNNSLFIDTRDLTALNDSQYFERVNHDKNNYSYFSKNVDVSFNNVKGNNDLNVFGSYSGEQRKGVSNNVDSITGQLQQLLSTNNFVSNEASVSSMVSVNTIFNHSINNSGSREKGTHQPFSNYSIDYRFNYSDFGSNRESQSFYEVLSDPGKNQSFDRRYISHLSTQTNTLTAALPSLISGGLTIGLHSYVNLFQQQQNNTVSDKNINGNIELNPYLTNHRQESNWTVNPSLSIDKRFNTKSGSFTLTVKAGPQIFTNNSSSQKLLQQFTKQYTNWIGNVSLFYLTIRSNVYSRRGWLQLDSKLEYPTIDQLAPIVDSINLNYIHIGNLRLKEQNKRSLRFSLEHTNLKRNKNFGYSLNISAEQINNYFTRSSYIDTLGRNISNTVNASGYISARVNINIKKAIKRKKNQYELAFLPGVSNSKVPQYINGEKRFFNNLSVSLRPSITYSYIDKLAMQVTNATYCNWYRENRNGAVNNNGLSNELSGKLSINFTKKFSLSTNIVRTTTRFNKNTPIAFTLWNGYLMYRLLGSNNLELKFSAMDILKQNKTLDISGINNTLTQVRTNALQQYFMVTLAYFPRQFGKKNK